FPNGRFVKIPYGGHGMARHLINMGVLKKYIISFIQNRELPKYNRKNKDKSSIYFRLLAKECLEHHKLGWAERLVDQSLEMLPYDKHAIKVKVDILKEKHLFADARTLLKTAIREKPKTLKHRLVLIDLLLESGQLEDTEEELHQSFEVFGKKSELKSKEKKLFQTVEG